MTQKQLTEETRTFEQSFNKLSKNAQSVSYFIALCIDKVNVQEIQKASSMLINSSRINSVFNELSAFRPYLQNIDTDSIPKLKFPPEYGIKLITELMRKKNWNKYTKVLYESHMIPWPQLEQHKYLLDCLSSFLNDPEATSSSFTRLSTQFFSETLIAALVMPEFKGLGHRLSFSTNWSIFKQTVYNQISNLHKSYPIHSLYNIFIEQPNLSENQKELLSDLYAIITMLLPGKLHKIPDRVSYNTPAGLYLHALYHQQIKKDLSFAIKLYENGIKADKETEFDILPQYPILSYSYALAICQSDSPEATRTINQFLTKRILRENPDYLLAYLLFQHKDDPLEGSIHPWIYKYKEEITANPQLQLLTHVVYETQCKDTPTDVIHIEYPQFFDQFGQDSTDWLKLEYLSVHPEQEEERQALTAKLGYKALRTEEKSTDNWEKRLDMIINTLTPSNRPKPKSASTKVSRVAYLIGMTYKTIHPIMQTSTDNINWKTTRNIALENFVNSSLPNPTDADLQMSSAIRAQNMYYGKMEYAIVFEQAISILIGHPALYLKENPNMQIELVATEPMLEIKKWKKGYTMRTNLVNEYSSLFVIKETTTRYLVLKPSLEQREIISLLKEMPPLPPQAKTKLLQLTALINNQIQIHSDLIDNNSGTLSQATADSRTVIQLQPFGIGLKAELYVKPFGTQPPYCRIGKGAKSILATINEVKSQALRNMAKEIENKNLVLNEFLQITESTDDSSNSYLFETVLQSLEMLERLDTIADKIVVEWPEGAKLKVSKPIPIQSLALTANLKNSLIEINGEVKVDEELVLSIQTLLTAVKKNSIGHFVELKPGEYLALTEKLRRWLIELEASTTCDKAKNILLPQIGATLIDDLSDSGATIKADSSIETLLETIKTTQAKQHTVPKQLKAELREYQIEGFQWMARLADWGAGACLADDMGLGKTIQTIALLLHKAAEGPSLIICPTSVLLNWKREINRFAPSLRTCVLNEELDRETLLNEATAYDVILVSFGLLINAEKQLTKKRWTVTAIDEAHTIKNKETKASKIVMQLQSSFRLLLTGTPIQNHLGEVWTLFSFITPGLLGSFEHFIENFINPITQNKDKNRQKQLKKLISPFLLRRTKQAVLDELPPKTEIVKEVEQSEEEKACYEALRREAEKVSSQSTASERIKVLAEITKLRMAACNINLVNKDLNLPSSKTEAFLEIVNELTENGHRSLVFSQFTTELAFIREALDTKGIEYLYLDGSTPIAKRALLVKEFQTGTTPIFLISLKAGGLGLNLTAADFVIHLDPWWNPAIEDQASDRVHRIGQERPVTIYRLIARNTIEEKIIKLHTTKRNLADSLLEGSDLSSKLTREELLELLK